MIPIHIDKIDFLSWTNEVNSNRDVLVTSIPQLNS